MCVDQKTFSESIQTPSGSYTIPFPAAPRGIPGLSKADEYRRRSRFVLESNRTMKTHMEKPCKSQTTSPAFHIQGHQTKRVFLSTGLKKRGLTRQTPFRTFNSDA